MTVMGQRRCLLGSMMVLQNVLAKKDLTSHPEPSAQLGVESVHVDAFRPTVPLALAVAPPAILLEGALREGLDLAQGRMVPGDL